MISKVLVLAGGFDQIALINELKKKSIYVIVADYYENPPAKKYADKHVQVSTLDEEAIYELAKKENVDLVTTACTDQALLTAARVSEKLNLPTYISAQTAMNVTNKAYMKRCFLENDIPTAKAVLLETPLSWKEKIGSLPEYPIVVKPCDCNSSKGVTYVENEVELHHAVEHAFELSRSGKVIIEQYIDGRELSIDVWIEGTEAKVLSASETEKMPNTEGSFTIFQSKYPVHDIERYRNKMEKIANDIAKSFQLSDCPMLIQVLIKGENIYVIEFSARMGGGTKYKLIEYMSGINIMQVYTNRILGMKNQHIEPKWSEQYIELDYLYTYKGVVTELQGFEQCVDEGIIETYFQYKPVGSQITNRKVSSDRTAGILLVANSREELEEARKLALDNIAILDNKRNILYKECF